ncbi:MAG: Ig-like domain-containing protein [Bacteroidales bacterium]|nr:Ig-like domain-containing protein [Bacteroidales bacterium]
MKKIALFFVFLELIWCCSEEIGSPTSVNLDRNEFTIRVGESVKLMATIIPDNTKNKDLLWKSSDPVVAGVDKLGVVIGVRPGSAIITVTTVDGNKEDSCAITVEPKYVEVSDLSIVSHDLTMKKGESTKLSVSVKPANATDTTVIWSSSDESIVVVDKDGTVTAIGGGVATISAMVGSKTATIIITVIVPTTELSVEETSVFLIEGEETSINIRITPSDATDALSFITNDSSIATVDNEGKITAISAGVTTVAVSAGDISSVCKVTVFPNTQLVSGSIDGHDYIDLGLSVKWASCNLGASNPWDIGDYYAWGQTTPYNEWSSVNYNFTYAPSSQDFVLDALFDAITVNWGKCWRMPTKEEIDELIDINNCDWFWVDKVKGTDISGYIVKSKKNRKSIFLPAGKYFPHESYLTPTKLSGNYWSSTTDPSVFKRPYDHSPFTIFFQDGIHYEGIARCFDGLTVRGVVGSPNSYLPDPSEYSLIDEEETAAQGFTVNGRIGAHTYVDLGLPSRTLWATYNVGAKMPYEYGEYYAWGETTPKDLYNLDTYKFFLGYSDSGQYHLAQLSKYVWWAPHGKPDYRLTLDPEDDAATVNWGLEWQTPSAEQIEEIAYYCIWYSKNITIDGNPIRGYIGESKINGHKLFLPCSDFKYASVPLSYLNSWYWSRDMSRGKDSFADESDYYALFMVVKSPDMIVEVKDTRRYQGLPVRPVVKH